MLGYLLVVNTTPIAQDLNNYPVLGLPFPRVISLNTALSALTANMSTLTLLQCERLQFALGAGSSDLNIKTDAARLYYVPPAYEGRSERLLYTGRTKNA